MNQRRGMGHDDGGADRREGGLADVPFIDRSDCQVRHVRAPNAFHMQTSVGARATAFRSPRATSEQEIALKGQPVGPVDHRSAGHGASMSESFKASPACSINAAATNLRLLRIEGALMTDSTSTRDARPARYDGPSRTSLVQVTAFAACLVGMAASTGCATPGNVRPIGVPLAAATVGLQGDTLTPELGEQWWRSFEEPELDALVAKALQDNPSLQAASARVARAQAVMERADAQRKPAVDARADATHQRFTENGLFPPKYAGKVEDTGNLQATFAWELDFFGRNRFAFEAALGAERATQAERESARLGLAVSVVRIYVQLAQLVGEREVAERTLAQRTQVLDLIRRRVQAGLDTQVELRQGEGAIPDIRLFIEALDEQITLRRHALAALTVQPPDALATLAPPIASLRRVSLPASVPADLLGRRADIDAARQRIEAATADLRSARADFYPSINLIAFAAFSAIGLDQLLDIGSRQAGIGPAVRLPIFDAGRLRASYRGRAADVDAAVAVQRCRGGSGARGGRPDQLAAVDRAPAERADTGADVRRGRESDTTFATTSWQSHVVAPTSAAVTSGSRNMTCAPKCKWQRAALVREVARARGDRSPAAPGTTGCHVRYSGRARRVRIVPVCRPRSQVVLSVPRVAEMPVQSHQRQMPHSRPTPRMVASIDSHPPGKCVSPSP
jgi:NodT family efflux transporter outer membrane factor (OMF) lipoprotein